MSDQDTGNARSTDKGLAADMALHSASIARADTFLDEQTQLARLQSQNLIEQNAFELSHLKWRRFNDQMSGALQIMLVALGLLIVLAIGGALWNAANDRGLVIEAFSVPPDMASRGLTGQVVASQLLDKLSAFEAQTASNRAPSSYANNWGNDIKVQIPDTGVSIGEFNHFFRSWLGHETHITGEVYRSATGIAVTARAGSAASPTFTGSETDLNALLQKAAEAVYHGTQPYRYAVFLANANRNKEAEAVYNALIANGSPQDRAWAYIGISNLYTSRGDFAGSRRVLLRALDLRPDFIMAYTNLAGLENQLQHDEAALVMQNRVVVLRRARRDPDLSELAWTTGLPLDEATLAAYLGDFLGAINYDRIVERQPEFNGSMENARMSDANAYAFLHDAAAVDRAFADMPPSGDPPTKLFRSVNRVFCDLQFGRWQGMLRQRASFESTLAKLGFVSEAFVGRAFWPGGAYALALSGDFAGAHGLIDKTPTDCTICLRMRGRIDALQKNWRGADYWFGRAAKDAPSPPFVYADWGEMLLHRGDTDGAIAKFMLANQKGPHFADPLEMWGEALIGKNRSDLALSKFEDANKYAPNWGRLHMKWGEALVYLGRRDQAHAQFALASRLELSAAEHTELARVQHG